jgi:hypothetical protein
MRAVIRFVDDGTFVDPDYFQVSADNWNRSKCKSSFRRPYPIAWIVSCTESALNGVSLV